MVAMAASIRWATSRLAVSSPRARGGVIELGGEPRAIGPEHVQLVIERRFAAIGVAPPLDGG